MRLYAGLPARTTALAGRCTRQAQGTAHAGGERPALPQRCVEALREHRVRQAEDRLAAGPLWQDRGLVFASTVGTPLDDHNVRRQFRAITEAAGLGISWVPRELRHTFVSLLSAHGVPVEAIALLAGHNQTATTELVYRHQIVPALTRGARDTAKS
jgi:site-specific recombinase XerD